MLRLLMLEEKPEAAEQALRVLQSAGLSCACDRVATEVEFRAALVRSPDLVLSDSGVGGFDGMAALAIARAANPPLPFIFLSGQMNELAVRRALDSGATDCVPKADLQRLPSVVHSALGSNKGPTRRASDHTYRGSPRAEADESAEYLLQRQAALERALRQQDGAKLSSLLSRTPPAPAALVMIESVSTRDRYVKLLRTADIEIDVVADTSLALRRLAEHVHALLFTDQLELIREARQLNAGSATHMVFIQAGDEAVPSEGLRAGANDVMPEEGRGEQFWAHLAIARRIVSFASSLQSAITDNRLLSTIDELTRVGNRRYFEHQWPREVARAVRFGRPLSLVMCDIDNFKAINDLQGHPVGDEVLTEFGERITAELRMGEDWVARVGGEEFAVVLPETGRHQAQVITERLRQRISAAPFRGGGGGLALPVTASFGFCSLESSTQRAPDLNERMILLADGALYDSKRSGRNRVTEAVLQSVSL